MIRKLTAVLLVAATAITTGCSSFTPPVENQTIATDTRNLTVTKKANIRSKSGATYVKTGSTVEPGTTLQSDGQDGEWYLIKSGVHSGKAIHSSLVK